MAAELEHHPLVALARSMPQRGFTGPTPEQVAVLAELKRANSAIGDLARSIVLYGIGPCSDVARQLEMVATRLRQHEIFEVESELARRLAHPA